MAVHASRRRSAARSGLPPLSCTRLHSQRTRSSPCSQASRNRLVVITRTVNPVSGSRFIAIAVRELSCTRPAAAGARGVGRVFMDSMVGPGVAPVHIQKKESWI